jgi:site-specific DNA-methyltransferase (adenine-specific)
MEYMATLPDKAFDLAIVDPPYGIGIAANPVRQLHDRKMWDSAIPGSEYFDELRRVSVDQIIWGGNYFPLPPTQCFLIWDKDQPFNFSLAMCEQAWTSFKQPAKMVRLPVRDERGKAHPTQKPVALYRWLLKNYAKQGQRILDTHLGSGSIAIACDIEGYDLVGCEIDADYIAGARKRLADHQAQPRLFDAPTATIPEQLQLTT